MKLILTFLTFNRGQDITERLIMNTLPQIDCEKTETIWCENKTCGKWACSIDSGTNQLVCQGKCRDQAISG